MGINISKQIILLIIFLALPSYLTSAVPRDLKFNRLSAYNELSSYYINKIDQDSLGFLWIATDNGLNKFDGHTITTYKAYRNNISTGLVSSQIDVMFIDSKGRIWIGTPVGISLYNREYDKFEPISSVNRKNGIEDIRIKTILEDANEQIVVVSDDKIYLYDEELKKFEQAFQSEYAISSILFDSNNGFWIGYEHGKGIEYFYSYEYNRAEYKIDLSDTNATVRALELYNDMLWAAAEHAGVISIDIKNRIIHKNYLVNVVGQEDEYYVINIVKDSDNNLWFIDHDGLKLYLPGNDGIKSYYNYPDDPRSLPRSVSYVFLDSQKNFYTAHKGDGVYVDFVKTGFQYFGPSQHDFWHTTMQNINAIVEDGNGNLWLAGFDGGINVFRWKDRETDYYFGEVGNIEEGTVTFLYRDKKDQIWASSHGNGLKKFDEETQEFITWRHEEGNENSLTNNDIRAIAEDSKGNFWLATNGSGVDYFDVKENKFYNYNQNNSNLPLNWAHDVFIDSKHNLWVGTYYGIGFLADNDSVFKQYFLYFSENERLHESVIYSIKEDMNREIWAATSHGLYYYDKRKDKFLFYNRFIEEPITSIEIDDYNNFWLGTNKGLFKLLPKTGDYYQFDEFDGLHGIDFNIKSSYKSNSTMFFGGPGGVTYFDVEKMSFNELPPKMQFTNFYLFNKKIDVYGKKEILKKEINSVEEVVLDYNYNFFTIEFVAFNYINPQRNRYLCKLEGFDKEWIDRGNQRNMSYTNLLPGKYVFKVKAANNDGVWNEDYISLKLRVLPPWYLSIWFFIFTGVVVISGLILFYKLRTQSLRRRSESLSKVVTEQTIKLKESNKELKERAEDLKIFNEILEERQDTIIQQSTTLKKQADDLKHKNEELLQLVNTRDRMFSIIAHDLRSPFNTILGFTDLLSDAFDKSEIDRMRQYAKYVHNASVSVFNLLENLLMWARSQTGQISFNPKDADLDDIILDTLNLVKETSSKKIQIIDSVNYKNYRVFMDIDMMRSVFRNILTNAVKFTAEGGLIRISSSKVGDLVEVDISDNGVGMEQELIEQILTNVEVESSLGTAGEKGAGMGLFIVHKFVKMNGGTLSIQSEKGRGSAFKFTLPVAKG